jgi:hypothetical protein
MRPSFFSAPGHTRASTSTLGIMAPPYAFPPAREAASGTGRALEGVRNGTTREERDRHGGPEIDLTGRPLLTGRYREFQF